VPVSNPLDILLAHNHWATRNLLDACAPLTKDQFHKRFEMGLGNLHDTFAHIIGAMQVWTDVLNERPTRPITDGNTRDVPDYLMLLDIACAELDEIAFAKPLDAVVARTRDGKATKYTRGGIITHVTTHGMHHRAQALNMLRHLGVGTLPPSSVAEWTRAVDPIA
jgi:uncharacterized damage-inducible protein DinB